MQTAEAGDSGYARRGYVQRSADARAGLDGPVMPSHRRVLMVLAVSGALAFAAWQWIGMDHFLDLLASGCL